MPEPLRIGLALGGGGAAALSYVGVLEELAAAGIRFDCVAGTSAGAVGGAALAAGRLADFRDAMTSLTRGRVFTLFDPTWARGGLSDGRRAMDLLAPMVGTTIEKLPIRFAAVATDLDTGEEVAIEHGSVLEAVRASIAIPGVFRPRTIDGRVLVDGGLVNPIPVSVARRRGAAVVIAGSILPRRGVTAGTAGSTLKAHELGPAGNGEDAGVTAAVHRRHEEMRMLDVMAKGSAVVQSHIAAARLRDDPPDAFLSPRSEHIGIFDLVRTGEAVEAGREVARRALPDLLASLEKARRQQAGPLRRLWSTALARPRAI
jgi:NTE family protein